MNNHTPGPWVRHANIIKSRSASCVVVRLPAYTDCVGDESPEQIARWDADARIIAAAPELLEALQELKEELFRHAEGNYFRPFLDKAEDAIAKAKGETE